MRTIRMSILATLLLLMPALPAGARVVVQAEGGDAAVADAAASAASRWESSLSARSGCLGTVTVAFEDLNARRGEYRTREAKVVIDIAVSAGETSRVAIHELAHHAFVACGGYNDGALAAAFYAAEGIPESRGWFDYSAGWSATPAELFAEAMTAVIDGGTAHGVSVSKAGRDVVGRWMRGQALSVPATTTTTTAPPVATTTTTAPPVATTTTTAPPVATTTTTTPPARTTTTTTTTTPPVATTTSTLPPRQVSDGSGSPAPASAEQPSVRLVSYLPHPVDEVWTGPPTIE